MKAAVLGVDSTLRTAAASASASASASAVAGATAAAATAAATATATAVALAVAVVSVTAAATSLWMILPGGHPGMVEELQKMCISPVPVEQLVDRSNKQTVMS